MAALHFANKEGTWDTSVGTPIIPDTMEFGIVYNTQISTSPLSKYTRTYELPGARWRARMTFSNMTPEESRPLLAWLADLRGSAGRFLMRDFGYSQRGSITEITSKTLNGTTNEIEITAPDGDLKVGDYFTLWQTAASPLDPLSSLSSPQLKIVTKVIDSNEYKFAPPARYETGDAFEYATVGDEAYCLMMLTSDDQAYHAVSEKILLSTITIEAIEVFS